MLLIVQQQEARLSQSEAIISSLFPPAVIRIGMRAVCVCVCESQMLGRWEKQSKQSYDSTVGNQTSKCLSEIWLLGCSPNTRRSCDCRLIASRSSRGSFFSFELNFCEFSFSFACAPPEGHVFQLYLQPGLMCFTCVLLFCLSVGDRVPPLFIWWMQHKSKSLKEKRL